MAPPFPLSNRGTDVRPSSKDSSDASTRSRLGVRSDQRKRVFQNMYCWTRELLPPVWAFAKAYVLSDRTSRQRLRVRLQAESGK
ncbi:hypothetical protein PoB_001636700 [Plakobranchus ocellatus]|uniref:Uncharacterized protein n=1 Tax=Plakobranchus ocellatus TaxID=259542 RepID=A0AAV3Z5R4_9GAST|nr:hypothetical protein PoB_001636700 [Plakobranchus ocellatus]